MNGYGRGAGQESAYSVESPKIQKCECGRVYPASSRSVNGSTINGIANGCIQCKPHRRQREMAKARARCRLTLARHIAKTRGNRVIPRDVACRYLARFGGCTFAVQTDVDAAEMYLENAKGQILGSVDMRNRYREKLQPRRFFQMPF